MRTDETLGMPPDDMEERVFRKVSWRIIPFIGLLYVVAFLDRVNVGFAALTMNSDIGLSPAAFGAGAAVFFLGYFLFEVPSTVILHRVGARFWIGRVMITWGFVSAAMVVVRGPVSFAALRFLLGLAEAGFFPGIILYLSYWYPAQRRATATAWFMAAAPIAGVIGSPLSAALMTLDGALGLKGWQWLFLVEGAPAVVLGVATFIVLSDRPKDAGWLAPDERDWLTGRMGGEAAPAGRHGIGAALLNPGVLLLALAYLGTSAGLYTVGIWTPLIMRGFGLSVGGIGLVAAIPSAVAAVGMVLWSRSSDRTGERHWHAAVACLLGALGMLLVARAGSSAVVAVVGLSLTAFGVNAAKPPLWCLPTAFLTGSGAAAGIGLINSLGTLGGALGPYLMGAGGQAGYDAGLSFVGGMLVVSAVVVLLLKVRSEPRWPIAGARRVPERT